MPIFDMRLPELEAYRPELAVPEDLDGFWDATLRETRGFPLDARFDPVSAHLSSVEVFDVTFAGWGGHPIKAWLLVPVHRSGRIPCVVNYLGYGFGRGRPHQWLTWTGMGFASLVMDTRGQGWLPQWPGATADPVGSGPAGPGFFTKGIESPQTYYFRRVYADAVRAIEAARCHPRVDPDRIALVGGSQGGALAIAAGALFPEVQAVAANVPALSHFRRATEIGGDAPYLEIVDYLRGRPNEVEQVFTTLSYFDVAVLARWGAAPALFSAGLMDMVCPPSCCYAAFNAWAGPSRAIAYPYNQHEGGAGLHTERVMEFLADRLG